MFYLDYFEFSTFFVFISNISVLNTKIQKFKKKDRNVDPKNVFFSTINNCTCVFLINTLIGNANVVDEQGQAQGQACGNVSIELTMNSDGNETTGTNTSVATNMTGNESVGLVKKERLGTVLEHGLCFKSDTQKSKGYFWKIFLLSLAFSLTNSIIVFFAPCYLPGFVKSICE